MLEILATIKSALSVTKDLRDIADNVAKAELKLAIADLTGQLAEIKLQAIELAEQNSELQREVTRLKSPPEVEYRDNVYFKADGDGPFCPVCYDNSAKLIRIPEVEEMFREMLKYQCHVCDAQISGVD